MGMKKIAIEDALLTLVIIVIIGLTMIHYSKDKPTHWQGKVDYKEEVTRTWIMVDGTKCYPIDTVYINGDWTILYMPKIEDSAHFIIEP